MRFPPSGAARGPAIRWQLLRGIVDTIRYRPLRTRLALSAVAPSLQIPEPLARLFCDGGEGLRDAREKVLHQVPVLSSGPLGRRVSPALEVMARAFGTIADAASALVLERSAIDAILLAPHTRPVAVVVIDMRNFSKLTAELDDTAYLTARIEEYLTLLTVVIERHRGVVFQYTGDGLLALFLPELTGEEAGPMVERIVCETAHDLHAAFDEMILRWKQEWRRTGRTGYAVGLGVGVSYGAATIGLIGSTGKKQFGVVGPPINMAAFLCSQASSGTVFVDRGSIETAGAAIEAHSVRLRSPKHHQRIEALSLRLGRTRAARRTIGGRITRTLGFGAEPNLD